MKKFVGRKNEIATFKACVSATQSHFVAVYGRRRVIKRFLSDMFSMINLRFTPQV